MSIFQVELRRKTRKYIAAGRTSSALFGYAVLMEAITPFFASLYHKIAGSAREFLAMLRRCRSDVMAYATVMYCAKGAK